MRKLVFGILSGIPGIEWIQGGAADEAPPRPFGVFRIVDGPSTDHHTLQPQIQVWIHDERGSYVRIDEFLDLVKSTLLSAAPVEDENSRIVMVEWGGDSPDLIDDGYNTNTRYSTFTLTGSK